MSNLELVHRPGGPSAVACTPGAEHASATSRIASMIRGMTGARRNAVLAFAVRVASAAIAFISQVALARWMGWQDYGVYVYAWTWVLVIGGLTSLGFNVAAIGVVINGLTAFLFVGGHKQDMNIRGAYLHMAADALVSLGVVVTGMLYLWQGWTWIDPVASIAIAMVIIAGTWSLFRQSLHLLFDPDHSLDERILREQFGY